MRFFILSLFFLPFLISCGGGDSEKPCASDLSLFIMTTWNSNGVIAPRVSAKVGVPLTATPIITGIPASCKGQEIFNASTNFPSDLSLNAHTDVISGTPAKAISIGSTNLVVLTLPGYKPASVLDIYKYRTVIAKSSIISSAQRHAAMKPSSHEGQTFQMSYYKLQIKNVIHHWNV